MHWKLMKHIRVAIVFSFWVHSDCELKLCHLYSTWMSLRHHMGALHVTKVSHRHQGAQCSAQQVIARHVTDVLRIHMLHAQGSLHRRKCVMSVTCYALTRCTQHRVRCTECECVTCPWHKQCSSQAQTGVLWNQASGACIVNVHQMYNTEV